MPFLRSHAPPSSSLRSHASYVLGFRTPPLAAPPHLDRPSRQPQQPQLQSQQPQPQQPQPQSQPPQLPRRTRTRPRPTEPQPSRPQRPQPQRLFFVLMPLMQSNYLTFYRTHRRPLQRRAPRSLHGPRRRAAASSGGAQQPLARHLRVDMAGAAATTEAIGAGSAISPTRLDSLRSPFLGILGRGFGSTKPPISTTSLLGFSVVAPSAMFLLIKPPGIRKREV